MGCSILEAKRGALNFLVLQSVFRGMLLKRGTNAGNGKMKDGNKTENWKMKLLIGLGFKVGFIFLFFIFPFPMLVPRFPFPVLVTPVFRVHIKVLTIRQRRRPWKRPWKIDSAFFQTISRFFRVAQLFKRRELMLALKREGNAHVQTEMVEIIALPYPSSNKKLKIWSFHVVVVHGRRRNVEKSVMHVQSYRCRCFVRSLFYHVVRMGLGLGLGAAKSWVERDYHWSTLPPEKGGQQIILIKSRAKNLPLVKSTFGLLSMLRSDWLSYY